VQWRRARFSIWRAARERKIEDRVARSVWREMNIRENYKRGITPSRSDISRFSRGTVTLPARKGGTRRYMDMNRLTETSQAA